MTTSNVIGEYIVLISGCQNDCYPLSRYDFPISSQQVAQSIALFPMRDELLNGGKNRGEPVEQVVLRAFLCLGVLLQWRRPGAGLLAIVPHTPGEAMECGTPAARNVYGGNSTILTCHSCSMQRNNKKNDLFSAEVVAGARATAQVVVFVKNRKRRCSPG